MSSLAARTDPNIARVWRWFTFQRELLDEAQNHLEAAARISLPFRSMPRPYEKHFTGQTKQEVEAFFDAQLAELDLLTTLEILASAEAALRLDFRRGVAEKRKDRIARRFRSLRNHDRVRLEEDILEAWAAEANIKVSEFRGLLKLRHWLAHGRYWLPKLGRTYDAEDVYRISTKLLLASKPLHRASDPIPLH